MSTDAPRDEHPAYGVIELGRASGRRKLFQVDYEQDHYITLRIKRASKVRDLATDWVHASNEVICEVAMSSVQFANFVTSGGSMPTPVTLDAYRDRDGKGVRPRLPDDHVAKNETYAGEVGASARKAIAELTQARNALNALLAGASIKKGDLHAVAARFAAAEQAVASTIPFVVQQAEEAIESRTDAAKADFSAHVDFSLHKLGERALGARLEEALAQGVDPASVGRSVTLALAPPATDAEFTPVEPVITASYKGHTLVKRITTYSGGPITHVGDGAWDVVDPQGVVRGVLAAYAETEGYVLFAASGAPVVMAPDFEAPNPHQALAMVVDAVMAHRDGSPAPDAALMAGPIGPVILAYKDYTLAKRSRGGGTQVFVVRDLRVAGDPVCARIYESAGAFRLFADAPGLADGVDLEQDGIKEAFVAFIDAGRMPRG